MSTDTHYHRSPYGTVSLVPRSALAWVVLTTVTAMAVLVAVELMNIAFFFEPYVMPDQQVVPLWTLQGVLSDIDIATLSIVMFGSLLALLALGLPLVFVTGSLGVVFIYLVGDSLMLNIIPSRIFPLMTNYQLSAIPLFIFMASMLERAGLIDEMFDVIYKWLGGFAGGLAAATVVASTILAAMVDGRPDRMKRAFVVAAATLLLSLASASAWAIRCCA